MIDSVFVRCPFCGERFEAIADASGGDAEYIEDCPVCCRPITMRMATDEEGNVERFDVDRD